MKRSMWWPAVVLAIIILSGIGLYWPQTQPAVVRAPITALPQQDGAAIITTIQLGEEVYHQGQRLSFVTGQTIDAGIVHWQVQESSTVVVHQVYADHWVPGLLDGVVASSDTDSAHQLWLPAVAVMAYGPIHALAQEDRHVIITSKHDSAYLRHSEQLVALPNQTYWAHSYSQPVELVVRHQANQLKTASLSSEVPIDSAAKEAATIIWQSRPRPAQPKNMTSGKPMRHGRKWVWQAERNQVSWQFVQSLILDGTERIEYMAKPQATSVEIVLTFFDSDEIWRKRIPIVPMSDSSKVTNEQPMYFTYGLNETLTWSVPKRVQTMSVQGIAELHSISIVNSGQ